MKARKPLRIFKDEAWRERRVTHAAYYDQTFIEAFNALASRAHQIAREKRWWDEARNKEIVALMYSELSEALEARRHSNPPDDKIPQFTGVEAEIADAIIRLTDMAPARAWRIAEALVAKLKFNKRRQKKHGGKLF